MSVRLTEEQLSNIQKRFAGQTKTHLLDTSQAVATERAKRENKSKYGNVKTEAHGIEFASSREAKRYEDLYLLEKGAAITDLCRQVPFELKVKGYKVCTYVADFTYLEKGKLIVNDAKGMKTSVYSLKKKLMKACLGIEIRET